MPEGSAGFARRIWSKSWRISKILKMAACDTNAHIQSTNIDIYKWSRFLATSIVFKRSSYAATYEKIHGLIFAILFHIRERNFLTICIPESVTSHIHEVKALL